MVRARIDSFVRELGTVSKADQITLVSGLEGTAGMRTHVVPTMHGDKVTFFTGERSASPTSLDELGLAPDSAEALRHAVDRPSGAVVACGPVGSGTTTLYAALDVLDTPDRVAVTIEDPVERLLHGVDQVAVDETAGLTFAQGLRRILDTDSDVLLVGEVRDRETAEIAFQAALSGRHVLTALHVPSAATAIRRLTDMGLEPTVVAAALNGVVAQRLVRRVCTDCRETHYASEAISPNSDSPLTPLGRGCSPVGGGARRVTGRASVDASVSSRCSS
ncbi:MAG TPA: ATPase, T2SS/T4P/T4SS family [Gaiellaceae bacterium]|nr:ATPase, T2SS/T4P/T4SS family [Gaiellaceae bacterium]